MDIARYDSIRIRTESETGQSEIAISQYGHSLYTPVGVEALCDTLITIASGEASSFQEGEGSNGHSTEIFPLCIILLITHRNMIHRNISPYHDLQVSKA